MTKYYWLLAAPLAIAATACAHTPGLPRDSIMSSGAGCDKNVFAEVNNQTRSPIDLTLMGSSGGPDRLLQANVGSGVTMVPIQKNQSIGIARDGKPIYPGPGSGIYVRYVCRESATGSE